MNWWVLRRRVHTSWLLAVVSVAVLGGVVMARFVDLWYLASLPWLLTAMALILTALYWRYVWMIPLCIVGGLLLGSWRGAAEIGGEAPYDMIVGTDIQLSGVVQEDTDTVGDRHISLRLGDVVYDGYELPGSIWVSVNKGYDIKRSDRVTVAGELREGFGSFLGVIYQAEVRSIERSVPGDIALTVRDEFGDTVRSVVPEPAVSLGLGYLLGQRRSLPPELDSALQISGLTHAIVASGYNLTILVRISRRLFMRISRFSAFAAASGMVVSFIAVTGMSPSMARAGLVTGLSLLAWYYGRSIHPFVLLPCAAAVTVLINPYYAWGDVGWQLSFAAFAGVMTLAPLMQAYFFGDKKPGTVRQVLGETLSAQIATLPILVAVFGVFSNVALLANLLVLPLVPLAMLLVFLTGAASLLVPPLAELIGFPTTGLLDYMIAVAMTLSSQTWAVTEVEVSWWFVPLAYALLTLFCVFMWKKTGYNFRSSNIVE